MDRITKLIAPLTAIVTIAHKVADLYQARQKKKQASEIPKADAPASAHDKIPINFWIRPIISTLALLFLGYLMFAPGRTNPATRNDVALVGLLLGMYPVTMLQKS